jgi:hypothetical protein
LEAAAVRRIRGGKKKCELWGVWEKSKAKLRSGLFNVAANCQCAVGNSQKLSSNYLLYCLIWFFSYYLIMFIQRRWRIHHRSSREVTWCLLASVTSAAHVAADDVFCKAVSSRHVHAAVFLFVFHQLETMMMMVRR